MKRERIFHPSRHGDPVDQAEVLDKPFEFLPALSFTENDQTALALPREAGEGLDEE